MSKLGTEEYPFDDRFYFYLLYGDDDISELTAEQVKQIELYKLRDDDFQEELKLFTIRLSLWFGNVMNVSTELFGLTDTASNASKSRITVGEPTTPHHGSDQKHLSLDNVAVILGGHTDLKKKTDQMPHTDFGIDPTKGTITENEDLEGKQMPGSIVYSLLEGMDREIYFMKGDNEKEYVKVSHKKALYFSGNKVHGGKTTEKPNVRQKLDLYPSIHVYLRSSNHSNGKEEFTIDTDAIAHTAPELLPFVRASEQQASVKKMGVAYLAAVKSAMTNPGGNRQVSRDVHNTAKALLALLDEDGNKKRKSS